MSMDKERQSIRHALSYRLRKNGETASDDYRRLIVLTGTLIMRRMRETNQLLGDVTYNELHREARHDILDKAMKIASIFMVNPLVVDNLVKEVDKVVK